ncbi:Vesicle transport through interaction with t-SNAREs 1 [Phytophthora palmivora]|uniref:Vesicle transport through interaction with t-SNAREs 1 n=1 Tax=Phytophthora palmivora TaxID=4796 RepID=A0A2P4YNX5_9STRA|nr:Vesicle transport through interaction with t-SNAREs 1 [Phytophthora palmivora]
MTEAFMGYSEDFEQCRDDAMSDIRSIPKARNQRERDDLTERAQGNISEAERYMRILESESRAGDSQDRRRMHQQLRTFKSQLDKLKANLERSKLMEGSQQRQQARAPQDNVARYQQRTDRIDDHLNDAQSIIARTEATAQNINNNLADQREQLINVRTNVDATREDTAEAGMHLKNLEESMESMRAASVYFGSVLASSLIWRAISKFT